MTILEKIVEGESFIRGINLRVRLPAGHHGPDSKSDDSDSEGR